MKRDFPPGKLYRTTILVVSQGVVDIKIKVVFCYMEHILKRNLCFDVNQT